MTIADDTEDYKPTNGFLRALKPASLARLRPHLEPVEFHRRQVIYSAGQVAEEVYFINRGLVSMVKPMADGAAVEIGAVGVEGVVCLSAILRLEEAVLDSVVHVPGDGLRIKTSQFHAAIDEDPALKDLTRVYAQFALAQMAQTAACNTLHPIEERLCRWLLVAHDSAGADGFPLTIEFLALMLGVQRPGVSIATSRLQKRGLIEKANGRITVTDRQGLEASACECYSTVRQRLDRTLNGGSADT